MSSEDRITCNDAGLFLIRVMVGIVFVYHGAQKLFGLFEGPGIDGFAGFLESKNIPFPVLGAWMAALAEFLGGFLLMAGILVRVAAVPLIITMLVGAFTAHWGAFSIQKGGMEYALTLAVVTAGLFCTGAGRMRLLPGKP